MNKILVTGTAGFIGMHLAEALLAQGHEVVGLDNVNDYYSVELKRARLEQIGGQPNYRFHEIDLVDQTSINDLFQAEEFSCVVHLAAQAGVRYSITNPRSYVDANVVGFCNILEACRHNRVGHLLYASSSSVYGSNKKQPFAVDDPVDHPVSIYAATKKANELMAHTYSHLYDLPTTGLRFFTVYGPWGRPDMAAYIFTKAILEGEPINVFNHGNMRRDFTYVADIVEAISRLIDNTPSPSTDHDPLNPLPGISDCPYRVLNIGNSTPEHLGRFIDVLEECIGKKANRNLMELQPGDVCDTFADISALENLIGFKPQTTIEQGLAKFVDWYRSYHQI